MSYFRNKLKNIIIYLSSSVKPLGYMENVSNIISQKEIYDIECFVYNSLKFKIYDHWGEIFKRNSHMYFLDKQILKLSKRLSIFWRIRFLQIYILRIVYFLFDFISILIKSPPKFHLYIKKNGNLKSKKTIVVFTNNKSRSSIFNINNQYLQYDMIVTGSQASGYTSMIDNNFNFKSRLLCLKLKIRFFYIPSRTIFHAMAAKNLFSIGFDNFHNIQENSGVFSREGTTSLAKMFLYVAGQYGFLRNVVYNLPAITPNVLFPFECENLVLISDALPFYSYKHINVVLLNDNPYLNWRNVANFKASNKSLGLLLGDDFNRWNEQKLTDRKILDQLKLQGCRVCFGRPHPQELTRPHRLAYYKSLVKDYPFLQLEMGNQEDYLKKIAILIVYSKSTMVQESLICNRPIIEYRVEDDHSPNKRILNISNQLGNSISDINKLANEINVVQNRSKDQQEILWNGFLKNLNISTDINLEVNKIFDNQLIKFTPN